MYFDIVKDLIGFILMIIFSGAAIVTVGLTSFLVYMFFKSFIKGIKNTNKEG